MQDQPAVAHSFVSGHTPPKVFIHDGRVFTDSLNVARVFSKNHRDVLKAISNLDVPNEFNERNFAPVEYADAKGERRPAYHLTRDGFTLLAFGFTGKKAMKFKLAYIAQFNRMEAELAARNPQPENGLLTLVGHIEARLAALESGAANDLHAKYTALLERHVELLNKSQAPQRTRVTPDETAEIIRLSAQGKGPAEIGKLVGRSDSTVSTVLRKLRKGAA